jgi:predicted amidohydrolase
MDIWALDRWQGEPTDRDGQEHVVLAWLNLDEVTNPRLADPWLPEVVRAALDPST